MAARSCCFCCWTSGPVEKATDAAGGRHGHRWWPELPFYLTSEALLDRINRTDITTEERMAVYANVNRAIGDNPVLGFGYGTFANSYLLYDPLESGVHYDRAHNTWLENAFELGVPAALALYLALGGLALTCLKGVRRRHRDWVFPATGVAASVLVGLHATLDFSLQLPAVAILYAVYHGGGLCPVLFLGGRLDDVYRCSTAVAGHAGPVRGTDSARPKNRPGGSPGRTQGARTVDPADRRAGCCWSPPA